MRHAAIDRPAPSLCAIVPAERRRALRVTKTTSARIRNPHTGEVLEKEVPIEGPTEAMPDVLTRAPRIAAPEAIIDAVVHGFGVRYELPAGEHVYPLGREEIELDPAVEELWLGTGDPDSEIWLVHRP